MNPRQRRGVLLMVVAAIGAIAVFVAVVGYVSQVRNQYGAKITVLKLTADVSAFDPVSAATVQQVQVPAKYAARTQLTNPTQLVGKIAAAPIPRGTYLAAGMLMDKPAIGPSQQEVAIMIDAETGVAGKVHTGSQVDVYATYDSNQTHTDDACAIRVLADVRVIQIGVQTRTANNKGQTASSVPITFSLSAADVLKMTAAESFAQKVRLALRAPGKSVATGGDRWCVGQTARSKK